jgi:hypothetical protein
MRTWKTAAATAKIAHSRQNAISAHDSARASSSVPSETGAARRRFQMPSWRASSTPMPTSMPKNRMNCTLMPAKACA